jgi:tetratricopeptide (TPR) repeat protein
MMRYLFIFITVFCLTLPQNIFAQQGKGYVDVKGRVKDKKQNLGDAVLVLYEGPAQTASAKTISDGRFNFKLNLNTQYTLHVSKDGYVSKKVLFDTKAPDKDMIYPYSFTVELFQTFEGVDPSVLKDPVTKIKYSGELGDFDFDAAYTESMKKEIDKIVSQVENARKNTYKQLVAKADQLFNAGNYEDAIKWYEKAIDADPYDDYPDRKIMEAEKLMSQGNANETQYKKLISAGDNAFATASYAVAKDSYSKALKLKPAEKYPAEKIAEIDKLMAVQKTEESYKAAIAKGDAAFNLKKYTDAKAAYNEALGIKSGELYPKQKIEEIDKLLADAETKKKAEEEAKAKEDAYKTAITKGDAAFTAKKWTEAKTGYNDALKLKPGEKYPTDKLAEITTLEKADADAKAKEDAYKAAVAKGDAALGTQKYTEAKAAFNEALGLKPNEAYPKQKIAEIDKLLADTEAKKKAEEEAKAKDDAYKAAITKGDSAFNTKKWDEAKTGYNEALKVKPGEKYPTDKLAAIAAQEKSEADAKANEDAYKNAIAKGDAAFNTKKWEEAKTGYNEALKVKPGEKYPTDKLAAIATQEKAEADAKAKDDAYKAAVAKGDAAFGTQKYSEAKAAFNEALALKSGEAYPKQKITEIDKLLADADARKKAEEEAKAKDDAYKAAIAKGDAAYDSKKWTEAKTGYNEALKLKPGEKYPTDKLAAIAAQEKADADAKTKEDAYKAAIAKGDAAFNTKKWTEAKTAFNEALSLKSGEKYPTDKLAAIDAQEKSELDSKAKEDAYKAAIAKGDAAFNTKKWPEAKTAFNEALSLKPGEKYPTDKLAAIETQEKADADAKAKEDAYKAAVAKADAAFGSQDYQNAKAGYNEALAIKANEAYPKQKISEIDKLLADADARKKAEEEAKKKDDAYKTAIAKADAAFGSKSYTEARNGYKESLTFKPGEKYPTDKLAEIAAIEKADQDAKAREDAYKAAIAKGDAAFNSKKWPEAKAGFNEALKLKAGEKYPTDKLAEIASIENNELNAKAKEDAYKAAVAKGDAAFNTKKWPEAKTAFNEALSLKPGEKYPTDKLAAIDTQEKAEADAKAKEDAYKAAVAKADAAFGSKDYINAKTAYNEALAIKANEAYPKQKISEIDKLLADADARKKAEEEAKAKDELYKAAIAKADAAFDTKKWTDARTGYNEALKIKPGEKYPTDKLAAITAQEKAEADATAKEEAYKAAIAKGDAFFGENKYTEAKSSYNEALKSKPAEEYPKQKIAEIDKLLADANARKKAEEEAKAKEDAYKAAVAKGDAAFSSKKWTEAKAGFNEALKLKPGEKYPTDKLAEITALEKADTEAKALENSYKSAITKADAAFTAKKYEEARSGYNEALALKPEESHPKQRITEIDKLLADAEAKKLADAEARKKDEAYKAAVGKGDNAFNLKKWDEAKQGYNEALAIKPGEKYPTDKLTAIAAQEKAEADARAKSQELEQNYSKTIAEGDALFNSKSYDDARNKYTDASKLKPAEEYPKKKISEIDDIILNENKKKLEENYAAFVKKGDDEIAAKKYNEAKRSFEMANKLKPAEQYPKSKLVEIENLLTIQQKNQAEQAKKDQQYQKAVDEADALFAKKDYPNAITSYRVASGVKPDEDYPKKRIVECQDLIKSQKKELEEIDFTNKEVAEKYLSELARKYPEGVTTENYDASGGKKIKRVIVNKGGVANDYREVTHNWGGVYYFKNGQSISKFLFNQETADQ